MIIVFDHGFMMFICVLVSFFGLRIFICITCACLCIEYNSSRLVGYPDIAPLVELI